TTTDSWSQLGIFPLPKLKTITIGNLAVKPPQWNDLNQRASSKPGAIHFGSFRPVRERYGGHGFVGMAH
ncbi:MAG: hypothetical protein QE283_03240, partial [Rhodoferax sp.]|nr:hypothetical protein [Rhodoferax sp.]